MTAVKLFNFLTRKKEIFKPLKKRLVGLYTCGPTVYNYAHIGNLRTYIFEDILRRTLEYAGFKVKHIMNLTDVDDKTIEGAGRAGKNLKDFTKFYRGAFFEDSKKLNILPPLKYTAATDHIPDMIRLISLLLKKKLAYRTGDGVFFDISKFRNYGKLSQLKIRKPDFPGKSGFRRASADEYEKENPQDFALWKAAKPGEPSWPAPFGKGRPGWHIECSAMSMKYLGKSFDIHAGGVDLLFPHHENEIAQSEGASGKKFVRYFVEGEHLLVDGGKMAKSLGNVYTLDALKKRGYNSLAFRYLALSAHYRSQLNFTWESLRAAKNSLDRLYGFARQLKTTYPPAPFPLRNGKGGGMNSNSSFPRDLKIFKNRFQTALFDDLNTPKALAVMWDLLNQYNKRPEKYDSESVLKIFYDFDKVLGLKLKEVKAENPPKAVLKLLKKREEARSQKQFEIADKIREKIRKSGWQIKDTPSGPNLSQV